MKKSPSSTTSRRFKVILLVDDQHTFEKRLSAMDEDEALRRAVRWVTTQMGVFKQGQMIKINIVQLKPMGEAVSIRTFKTRPLNLSESLSTQDRIRIPKGVKYRSANPQNSGILEAKRAYITTTGAVTKADDSDVNWMGSGGYVCWTDKVNVEKVVE